MDPARPAWLGRPFILFAPAASFRQARLPSNSRRNAPDTISSAEARQQLICAPDDAVKPRYFPEQRGNPANGYADTALAARWPATAPDSADRRAGQQGNQPSLVPVTALCVCFRLLMRV